MKNDLLAKVAFDLKNLESLWSSGTSFKDLRALRDKLIEEQITESEHNNKKSAKQTRCAAHVLRKGRERIHLANPFATTTLISLPIYPI